MIREGRYVSPYVVRAVEDMAWSCSLDLGLRLPGERCWITIDFARRHEDEDERWRKRLAVYWTQKIEIGIGTDLDEARAAEACAHELRHAFQFKNWPEEDLTDAASPKREADCREYQKQAMERFWSPYRHTGSATCGAIGITKLRKVEAA